MESHPVHQVLGVVGELHLWEVGRRLRRRFHHDVGNRRERRRVRGMLVGLHFEGRQVEGHAVGAVLRRAGVANGAQAASVDNVHLPVGDHALHGREPNEANVAELVKRGGYLCHVTLGVLFELIFGGHLHVA